jgi:hypothetical protein
MFDRIPSKIADFPTDCAPVADLPETRYAKAANDLRIAYQVVGDGPFDLVAVLGYVSHLELAWEDPAMADCLRGLASFSRGNPSLADH